MTGIELIAKERKEQIEKHGFTIDHDSDYVCDELIGAAAYALFPTPYNQNSIDWGWFTIKIQNKTKVERLAIAGALIAAEIDRLQREQS